MNATTRRRPVTILHRARPAAPASREETERKRDQMPEEYKRAYIDFINKLMDRMKAGSLEKMLDLAMEEIDK